MAISVDDRSGAESPANEEEEGMKTLLVSGAVLAGVAACLVVAHLMLIEVGREVVTLRTQTADGGWQETRLWVVDDDGVVWLHSAGPDWVRRFEGDPVVELERAGEVGRYSARPVPGPHPRIDGLLRAKYGIADRWVRFIAPCDESTVVVRLDPRP
jgi:hypothetical protein